MICGMGCYTKKDFREALQGEKGSCKGTGVRFPNKETPAALSQMQPHQERKTGAVGSKPETPPDPPWEWVRDEAAQTQSREA